jgi:hypothetical protein
MKMKLHTVSSFWLKGWITIPADMFKLKPTLAHYAVHSAIFRRHRKGM